MLQLERLSSKAHQWRSHVDVVGVLTPKIQVVVSYTPKISLFYIVTCSWLLNCIAVYWGHSRHRHHSRSSVYSYVIVCKPLHYCLSPLSSLTRCLYFHSYRSAVGLCAPTDSLAGFEGEPREKEKGGKGDEGRVETLMDTYSFETWLRSCNANVIYVRYIAVIFNVFILLGPFTAVVCVSAWLPVNNNLSQSALMNTHYTRFRINVCQVKVTGERCAQSIRSTFIGARQHLATISVTWLRSHTRKTVCLSVVCNVRAPCSGLKFSAMFLRHLEP